MNTAPLELERKGSIAIVTINRPERRNAFNAAAFDRLAEVTQNIMAALPRAVIITGTGHKSFSAGFDVNPDNPMVNDLIQSVEHRARDQARQLIDGIRNIVDAFASIPVPIIAALNGLAYGGGAELAVRCDLRVMDPNAVFCFSEVRLGLMTDWGGGAALASLIGPARAADLILTARKVKASEALTLGMVNRISAPGEALSEALDLARAVAENGPNAVRHALSLIRASRDIHLRETLSKEADLAVSLIASGECFHGVAAFLEKRKPVFPELPPIQTAADTVKSGDNKK